MFKRVFSVYFHQGPDVCLCRFLAKTLTKGPPLEMNVSFTVMMSLGPRKDQNFYLQAA